MNFWGRTGQFDLDSRGGAGQAGHETLVTTEKERGTDTSKTIKVDLFKFWCWALSKRENGKKQLKLHGFVIQF